MRTAIQKRHALLYPLGVYAFSRLVYLFATATGPQLTSPHPSIEAFIVRWDATYYLSLVRDGYPDGSELSSEHAFFPLYPLTVRAADLFLPGGDFIAAVTVSIVAGAAAAVLLWRVACALADAEVADRAVLVFCLFPGTIVFGWPYADALLLAFMCGSILLLAQGRLPAGAAIAALAGATRPSGLILVVACAIVAHDRTAGSTARRVAAVAGAAAIAASGFLAFQVWLWNHTGNAFQWFDVEREVFGEGTPWKRLPTTIADIFRDGPEYGRLLVAVFAVIALVLLVAGVGARQPMWAKAVTVLALYLALTANIATASPRLQLAAIPAFVALGDRLRPSWLVYWCVGSVALGTALVLLYGVTITAAP
jgi:Mannosyltransferase (PIG-V)